MNKKQRAWVTAGAIFALVLLAQRSDAAGVSDGTEGQFYADPSLPRGIRNNNPGNIKLSDSNPWQGKVPRHLNTDPGKTFEQFWEYRFGVRAMIVLLRNYIYAGNDTVRKIITRWAPPSVDPTESYIQMVEDFSGLHESERINPGNKEKMKRLVQAMARVENGVSAVTAAQFNQGWEIV